MGSANGRHRRPRQAPAIVVAAGVTGSALAIPLLGAASAHAADSGTWDRVADCESGGSWSADYGNGSYGGLQFTPELWKAYGGEAYAERADLASRSQQIAVAERVLAAKGPKAWPSCAVVSGLTKAAGKADVDPGDEDADEPARSADAGLDAGLGTDPVDDASSATPSKTAAAGEEAGKGSGKHAGRSAEESGKGEGSASRSAAPSGTPSADPSAGPGTPSADPSATPSADASADPSADPSAGASDDARAKGGKHRGAPAADEAAGAADGRDAGRHASRGDGDARDGATRPADGTYTVRPGDNLWAIADAQDLPGGWPELYEANKAEVGADPDLILPGQNLDLGLDAPAPDKAAENAG
ncbi:LysM peptidoglycan-binding domain-containing protein [Streptomyces sp. 130]|uniref:LysM peptidoglycan-binding domain-containing protein n=1 Tax=Streptomyces sp. 130 TaxID=2591006 RepID=UPI00117E0746|nr:transglycosylase family protein [Streptomyces sp. 130]TRV77525.1 LysM peptidoglycan-binding domain-containing protein [Streptomyces sp. 130]